LVKRILRRSALLACALAALPAAAASAQSQQDPCTGETSAANVPQKPGAALRFGITPGVQTGQLGTGPQPPRTPEDPAKQLEALHRLVPDPARRPFVLRLHRFFWSDGEPGVQRFLELADRYTRAGYLVELQLRYHPNAEQEGDIAAWTAFVRSVVDRFGSNRRVVAIQVTNEVNLPDSPDSSDGAYSGGQEALVQGVIAAKDEARRRGYDQLRIGFNWAYRSAPQTDDSFWAYLRDHGGPRFLAALDWIGLDAYPGTFFPPAEAPGRERDGMVNAMSSLRCYAARAHIPASKPIHVEENGFPTNDTPDRSEQRQVDVMKTLVGAVQDFRGTYDVSDYRWFNLRDGNTQSPNFQVRYGLLRDDYGEKPAFGVYRDLVSKLSATAGGGSDGGGSDGGGSDGGGSDGGGAGGGGAAPGGDRRPRLLVRCVRHGWRASLHDPPRGTRRVDFLLDGRVVRRDRHAPFRATLLARLGGRHRRAHVLAARVPHGPRLQARAHRCANTATHVSRAR
jgi:hypothetical protein